MEKTWILSPDRILTEDEKKLVWKKPDSHKVSEQEIRISDEIKCNWSCEEMKISNILLEGDAGTGKTELAKALSANFGLPYTKITCFADMDKSDILGAILPVLSENQQIDLDLESNHYLKILYKHDSIQEAIDEIVSIDGGSREKVSKHIKQIIQRLEAYKGSEKISYRFYPSEIVRAFEKGYLLEIQEPTVIRDAAVLMALNSALEPDGSINLPTGMIKRHPDFIVVITTNRGYTGCRLLNEALRDRIHHAEKMDLPSIETMMERARVKTGCTDKEVLSLLAHTIITLDQVAKASAIKGVAGMRSYFYWVDAVIRNDKVKESLYHKVIYKMTTDQEEIKILEEALVQRGIMTQLEEMQLLRKKKSIEVVEIDIKADGSLRSSDDVLDNENAIGLKKANSSEGHSDTVLQEVESTQSEVCMDEGNAYYHELKEEMKESKIEEQKYRKKLNIEARKMVADTIHQRIKMIVHRPEITQKDKEAYQQLVLELSPTIEEMIRRAMAILEHEHSESMIKNKMYGTHYCIENVAKQDFRYFSRKNTPENSPTLAVALRIDESASMAAFGRIEAARRAAVAVYEFCTRCKIPVLIYGDTADRSKMEQMSMFAYCDIDRVDRQDCFRLMNIQPRSNNRDGMSMRILAEKLLNSSQQTKLMICISDGQPKAMPNYSGNIARYDLYDLMAEYRKKGITFLAAAIGQDKELISELYGRDSFLDISDLKQLPLQLIDIITRYL